MSTCVVGPSKQDEAEAHAVKMQIINDLENIRDGIEDALSAELAKIMLQVQQLAIEMCPKDTGSLASSISLEGGSLEKSAGPDFYEQSIFAGSEGVVNPKTGVPTSTYALMVHDGHSMPDGGFYEGVPFLSDALAAFEGELESAVQKALVQLTEGMD